MLCHGLLLETQVTEHSCLIHGWHYQIDEEESNLYVKYGLNFDLLHNILRRYGQCGGCPYDPSSDPDFIRLYHGYVRLSTNQCTGCMLDDVRRRTVKYIISKLKHLRLRDLRILRQSVAYSPKEPEEYCKAGKHQFCTLFKIRRLLDTYIAEQIIQMKLKAAQHTCGYGEGIHNFVNQWNSKCSGCIYFNDLSAATLSILNLVIKHMRQDRHHIYCQSGFGEAYYRSFASLHSKNPTKWEVASFCVGCSEEMQVKHDVLEIMDSLDAFDIKDLYSFKALVNSLTPQEIPPGTDDPAIYRQFDLGCHLDNYVSNLITNKSFGMDDAQAFQNNYRKLRSMSL